MKLGPHWGARLVTWAYLAAIVFEQLMADSDGRCL